MAGAQLPKIKLPPNSPPHGSAGHLLMHGDELPLLTPSMPGGDRLKLSAPKAGLGSITKAGGASKPVRQPKPRITL